MSGGAGAFEGSGLDWDSAPDLTSVPKEDLGSMLGQLVEQERDVSCQRRILQGRIDLIRAEIVRRGDASLTPEELARVLMDRARERPGEAPGGGREA